MDKLIKYVIEIEYTDKKEGIDYILKGDEMFFNDMLTSALRNIEQLKEIKNTNIEKKVLSLLKSEKISGMSIDIKVASGGYNADTFLLYRYVKNYDGVKKLEYDIENKGTLKVVYENKDIKESIKNIQSDFKICKDYLKEEINRWIIENLDN